MPSDSGVLRRYTCIYIDHRIIILYYIEYTNIRMKCIGHHSMKLLKITAIVIVLFSCRHFAKINEWGKKSLAPPPPFAVNCSDDDGYKRTLYIPMAVGGGHGRGRFIDLDDRRDFALCT